MHHLQKHLSFLSIISDRYIDMPDLLLTGQSCKKTEKTIPAGQHETNVLPMAYKSKALNPNHTAGPDSTSVSA